MSVPSHLAFFYVGSDNEFHSRKFLVLEDTKAFLGRLDLYSGDRSSISTLNLGDK